MEETAGCTGSGIGEESSFYDEEIPDVILEHIFGNLRVSEVTKCSLVSHHWRRNALAAIRRMERTFAVAKRFTWQKILSVDRSSWQMEERIDSAICYMRSNNSIFLFGGSTPDTPTCKARFNDLWRLDLRTLIWKRLVVRANPFPVPKSLASFVPWDDNHIVLFGGYRPALQAPIRVLNEAVSEVHVFSVSDESWKPLETITDGPGLCGHAAAISENLMVVFGGVIAENQPNDDVFALDLRLGRWIKPAFAFGVSPTSRLFSSLILIRPGVLLLVNGMGARDNATPESDSAAWLLTWNTENLEDLWKWKRLPSMGRRCGQVGDRNRVYSSVASWTSNGKMRMASLGMSTSTMGAHAMRQMRQYDKIEDEMRMIVNMAKCELDAKFKERFSSLAEQCAAGGYQPQDTQWHRSSIDMTIRGVNFKVFDIWNIDCEKRKFGSSRDLDPVRSRVDTTGKKAQVLATRDPSQCFILSDCDIPEMAVLVRMHVASLHTRYYLTPPEPRRPPRAVVRRAMMPRLVLFLADITNIEEEEVLQWEPQQMEMRASPLCQRFSLIATDCELVMHGGITESEKVVGSTYLLSPVCSL